MNELDHIPELADDVILSVPVPVDDVVLDTKPSTKKRKRVATAKKKKKPRKPELVKRYLDNFDSSKQIPTEDQLKEYDCGETGNIVCITRKAANTQATAKWFGRNVNRFCVTLGLFSTN